jgi:hypothetical protein
MRRERAAPVGATVCGPLAPLIFASLCSAFGLYASQNFNLHHLDLLHGYIVAVNERTAVNMHALDL